MKFPLIIALALVASGGANAEESQPVLPTPDGEVAVVSTDEIAAQCRLETARLKSASGPWQEGIDYTKLDLPQAANIGSKIEVVEFFAYWCQLCGQLQPELESWARSAAQDVALTQIPFVLPNEYSRRYATLYYTFIELGRPELHNAFYAAVERSRRAGDGNLMRPDDHLAFARSAGIETAQFESAYRSTEVAAAVARAEALTRDYAVDHAPTIVVQGRYRIESNPERRFSDLLRFTNFLIDRARVEGDLQASQVIRDPAG